MWTVFAEFYAARSAAMKRNKPSTAYCLKGLKETQIVIAGYIESLTELLELDRRKQATNELHEYIRYLHGRSHDNS
jgi:hypothetical protein